MDEPTPVASLTTPATTPEGLVDQAIASLQAAKVMLRPKTGPTLTQQFKHFVRHFRDNPVKNTIKVSSFLLFVAIMIWLFVVATRSEQKQETLRRESQSYVAQTQSLDNVKKSLNSLLDFVQAQKDKLQQSEDIVNNLQAEQEKLKPVVETNRQIIDAILDLQAQKARSDVWKERGIGFGSGILASIIASFMYGVTRRFSRKSTPPVE